MLDVEKLIANVHEYVERAVSPLHKRIAELEARHRESNAPDALASEVAKAVAEYMAEHPVKHGLDGKDIDPNEVAAMVRTAVAAIPAPKDGADAPTLQEVVRALIDTDDLAPVLSLHAAHAVAEYMTEHPVKNGIDGADADPEVIRSMVRDAVAQIPVPKNGADAPAVTDDQIAAQVAKHLQAHPPKDGENGIGLAGALIDRAGELVVTLSNGEQRSLGPVVGKDGRDGLNAEDFTGEYIAERGFVIHAPGKNGPVEFVLPYYVHRDFWTEGKRIKAGESVTHDGALWIAKRDTVAKPCLEAKEDWVLAARKGRDGKDGKNGIDRTAPVKVNDDA